MSTDIQSPPEQSTAALVGGILSDVQSLIQKQFLVTRLEVEAEIRRRAGSAAALVIGLALCLVGSIVICIGLAYLLHTLTTKMPTDSATVPLWGCYEIVGFIVLAGGGLMANAAKSSLMKPKLN